MSPRLEDGRPGVESVRESIRVEGRSASHMRTILGSERPGSQEKIDWDWDVADVMDYDDYIEHQEDYDDYREDGEESRIEN